MKINLIKNKKGFSLKTRGGAREKSQKGFSLIETIVYFTLLSIILLMLTDLFLRLSDSFLESKSKGQIEIEGERAIRRLIYDIRRTDSLITPPNPGDVSTTLELDINGTSHIYSLNSATIELDDGQINSLSSNTVAVQQLTFTNISTAATKPTIKINFSLDSATTTKTGVESKGFETVVSLR